MPEILHDFFIKATPSEVFRGVSDPACLDEWWTKKCAGTAGEGGEYELYFTPEYIWRATITRFKQNDEFELTVHHADADWEGTKVGFRIIPKTTGCQVQFYHTGWSEANEHFRISSYCWASYLRVLRRFLELGERVPYEKRDEV